MTGCEGERLREWQVERVRGSEGERFGDRRDPTKPGRIMNQIGTVYSPAAAKERAQVAAGWASRTRRPESSTSP